MSQPLPLREQMKALEQVQEIDLKIDQLTKSKNSLPVTLKALDDSLQKIKSGLDGKRKAIEELQKVQRQTQAALDLNRDRLTRSSTRLEGVQNSQEFSAINKELEQLKKLNASLDEQSKKSVTDIGAIEKEITELTSQYEKMKVDRELQVTQLSGQGSKLETEIATLVAERKRHVPSVESRILSQYDRIRGARGGVGLVPALGGRCKGCNMMVPPQLYNEIQRGNVLHGCPSCHRLLFIAGDEPPKNEATASQAG